MIKQLLKILFIFLLSPVHVFAQSPSPLDRNITGLWKGSLYNDTTKKMLPYEIAISEEKGKLSGYSYTLFDIDGKKELGVKKIKIKRKDDQLIIEDVELISNDYSTPPPRKVRQLSVVNLLVNDTAMHLTGKWSTNQTREYSPLTGTVQLQRAIEYKRLVLFKILVELKLDNDLSFVQAENKRNADAAIKEKTAVEIKPSTLPASKITDADIPIIVVVAAREKKTEAKPVINPSDTLTKPTALPVENTVVDKPVEIVGPAPMKKTSFANAVGVAQKMEKKPGSQSGVKISAVHIPANIVSPKVNQVIVAVNDSKKINNQPAAEKATTIITSPVTKKAEPVAIIKEPANKENKPPVETGKKRVVIEKPEVKAAPVTNNKTAPATAAKEPVKTEIKTIIPPAQKKELPAEVAAPDVQVAAANVAERKMSNQQGVLFESDSLVLTLYDNGDVDGDTVSVLMNGQVIFAKQGLTTKANSKTIYIERGMPDTLSMIMYAENLGSIPPNTGLLIIMDGEKRYEVRFSADLKTNAAILLRRKKIEK